jgi:DNA-binding transcriptional LysR family regulator
MWRAIPLESDRLTADDTCVAPSPGSRELTRYADDKRQSGARQSFASARPRTSRAAGRRPPAHPRDLVDHETLSWRPTSKSPAYRWEFSENGREFSVAVPARMLTSDWTLNLRLARAGIGLTIVYED